MNPLRKPRIRPWLRRPIGRLSAVDVSSSANKAIPRLTRSIPIRGVALLIASLRLFIADSSQLCVLPPYLPGTASHLRQPINSRRSLNVSRFIYFHLTTRNVDGYGLSNQVSESELSDLRRWFQ